MNVVKFYIKHIYNSTQYILVEKRPTPESDEKKNNNNNNKQIKMPKYVGATFIVEQCTKNND